MSVNENKANTRVNGDLVSSGKENITVTSTLTQNLDGDFAGKLAAQALSGSVAGKDSSVSIAGAVSVLVSHAESTVDVAYTGEKAVDHYDQVFDHYETVLDHYDKVVDHYETKTWSEHGILHQELIPVYKEVAVYKDVPVYKEVPVYKDVPVYVDVPVYKGATITGGGITVEATDKSKLAIRAGGVSLSGGSSFGMGLSSATVVSGNKVTASVSDDTFIKGKSFTLNAEKLAVTAEDYKNLINQKYLVTDSSALTEEQRQEANTGLIDMHKDSEKEGEAYKVKIGLSSDKLLDAMDGLNFLSSQNTYVEAIAGSVMTGKGKTNLAGSFAVAVTDNEISAVLGKGANITLTGDMRVTAKNGTEDKPAATRIIAGSLSAGPAKAAVGATVAVLVSSDEVKAETGGDGNINAAGNFTHDAVTVGDIQVFTAAMAVAAGAEAGTAADGAVNVIVTKNQTESAIGEHTDIQARGDASVQSDTRLDLIAISGSANVSAGAGSKVAAGGVVNVIVDKATAETKVGDKAKLTGFRNGIVASNVNDRMLVGTASLSVAAGGSAINPGFNDASEATAKEDNSLPLGEVSAKWLVESIGSGLLRPLTAGQETVGAFMNGTGALPEDGFAEGITEETDAETGRKLYWIDCKPDTAPAGDTALLLLIVNEETDQAAAYRTTPDGYRNGEALVPVSLFIFQAMDAEGESYCLAFIDTPEGQESTVTVVPGHTALTVVLRAIGPEDAGSVTFLPGGAARFVEITDQGFILRQGTPVKADKGEKNAA